MARACISVLAVVFLTLSAEATAEAAERRAHGTHGTVRRVCADAEVRRWPGGPLVGVIREGRDMRRYSFRGHWALGVSQRRPFYRGYVLSRRFCPPSAAGRRALERDRRPTGLSRPRSSSPLPAPQARRVCADDVWLRDAPLNRAIGILWMGDVFVASRSARNPHVGGEAKGHEQRRGWVPRSSLCGRLPARPPGYRLDAIPGTGLTLLAPPATMACDSRVAGRRLVEVGVDGGRRRGAGIRADLIRGGETVRGPHFTPGEAVTLRRGAVGPFRCGETVEVVYRRAGRDEPLARYPVTIRSKGVVRALARAAASAPTSKTAKPPGLACAARPTLVYAHGHAGPVSHRYDARPALSADGRVVAFDTPLALLAADRDRTRDVYVRGRDGKLRLLSRSADGRSAGATSRAASVSADGRRVAFESDAAGLVPGDRNGARDVFLVDGGGAPRAVSVTPAGAVAAGRSRAPSLSADGRLVAFESTATDLITGAPRQGIYLRDLGAGTTRLLVAGAYRPALSADGGTLVFESAGALTAADRNRTWDVYALRIATRQIVLVSRARSGHAGNDRSLAGVPSRDGRFVAFMSAAGDLVRGDRDGLRDVFRRDLRSGRSVLISKDRCGGFANGYSRYPSISADGGRVAFDSHAGDIAAADTDGRGEVYVRDVADGRTILASARPDGRPGSRTSFSPALSADGRVAAFPSFSPDLVRGDRNRKVDQFVRRLAQRRARRASAAR